MAGTSKPQDILAGSGEPVGDQMKALKKKAERLVSEKNILSKRVVSQIQKLIDIGSAHVSSLCDAERREIKVSGNFEKWLENVYAAISRADDLLDYCDYHVQHHLCLQQIAEQEKPKATGHGLICGKTVHKYLVKPVNTHLVSPVSSFVVKSCDAFLMRPMNERVVTPLHSYLVWGETSRELSQACSKLNNQILEDPDRNVTERSMAIQAEKERSATAHGMVDVSDAEMQIVGKDKEVDKIVSALLYSHNDDDLPVIRIVGWRDTGKTALTGAVYKNDEVIFHFDERMWVHVPETFNAGEMAKSMLSNLTRTTVDELSHEVNQRKLKDRLKGKRYLLVVDGDIEANPPFIEFLRGLGGCRGSKLLATVSSPPTDKSWFVMMKMETDEYCLALFENISFGDEDDAELKKLSAALVKEHCQHSLLNVKLLGSLMKRMKGERRWLEISDKLKGNPTLTIPQLCFDSMSSLPLKRCFQYCCFFPRGCLIRREEITELWMAQGYLNSTGADMIELGILYYDILLKSGFLQVSEDDDFDKQSCKVPDLLWDMVEHQGDSLRIVEKMQQEDSTKGVQQENLSKGVQQEDPSKGVQQDDCSKVVHLSLVNCRGKLPRTLWARISKLRTLHLERNGASKDKLLREILASAKSLRVLIIVDGSLEKLPSSVGKLKYLKYLDISRTKVARLPELVSLLYNLQTLRLDSLKDSPKSFENLGRTLRHLYIQNDLPTVPSKFHGFVKCAKGSIKVFMDKNGKIDAWEKMKVPNRCSSISIHRLENASSKTVKGQTTVLLMKREVETLKLHWTPRRENCFDEDQVLENLEIHEDVKNLAIENFKGTTFPTWMVNVESNRFLHKMVKLELENCSWCQKLPSLGHLRCLKILRIVKLNSVCEIGDEFYHGSGGFQDIVFPSLKVFVLCRMKNLHNWQCNSASENTFSSLVRLEVEKCPVLTAIPDSLVQNHLLKLRIAHCDVLTALPARIGRGEAAAKVDDKFLVNDLELFGLPLLKKFSIEGAKKLESLRIGCISTKSTEATEAIGGLPDIQIEHLSTLTSLAIWGYGHKKLPSWIPRLDSLKILKLEFSETLESFPENMQPLEELSICNCPLLEDRCMKESRPEWKKVSSIPTIVVNGEETNRPHM